MEGVVPSFDQLCLMHARMDADSSWAFAAVATIESLHSIKTGKLVPLSEQQLVDCDQYDGGCNRGSYHRAYNWIVENGGLTTAADYPYTAVRGACNRAKSAHHVVQISGSGVIPPRNEPGRQHPVAGQPIGVAVEVGSGASTRAPAGQHSLTPSPSSATASTQGSSTGS